MSDYREPEPEPAVLSRGRAVCLSEAVEDVRKEVRVNPRARVRDVYLDARVRTRETHVDVTVVGRELERVPQELLDDLLQARGVARDVARQRVERDFKMDIP